MHCLAPFGTFCAAVFSLLNYSKLTSVQRLCPDDTLTLIQLNQHPDSSLWPTVTILVSTKTLYSGSMSCPILDDMLRIEMTSSTYNWDV